MMRRFSRSDLRAVASSSSYLSLGSPSDDTGQTVDDLACIAAVAAVGAAATSTPWASQRRSFWTGTPSLADASWMVYSDG